MQRKRALSDVKVWLQKTWLGKGYTIKKGVTGKKVTYKVLTFNKTFLFEFKEKLNVKIMCAQMAYGQIGPKLRPIRGKKE